jgi:hypothetical protein
VAAWQQRQLRPALNPQSLSCWTAAAAAVEGRCTASGQPCEACQGQRLVRCTPPIPPQCTLRAAPHRLRPRGEHPEEGGDPGAVGGAAHLARLGGGHLQRVEPAAAAAGRAAAVSDVQLH